MRRIATFSAVLTVLLTALLILTGCQTVAPGVPDRRPGDFRLGVVVMGVDSDLDSTESQAGRGLAGGDARYIIESASVLRASFGSGSTLDTYPGFTRRLTPDQMNAVWSMARDLLKKNNTLRSLNAGQPQSMVSERAGTIIEIHHNAYDNVLVFDHGDQQAAAIVDALAALSWVHDPSTP